MSGIPPVPKAPVRVLLVDDSAVALMVLQRILSASPDVVVVGTARSGSEALAMIPKCDPDVVCTDLHMPDMDGLELTRKIVELYPRPVLVVSASTQPEDTHNVFRVLEAGAIDVIPKPLGGADSEYDEIARDLISKIKILAGVFVFRRRGGTGAPAAPARVPDSGVSVRSRIVVIGASTGGPQVLQRILSALPAGFGLPIVCIQHIAHGFLEGFGDWLRGQVKLKVKIVSPGERPEAGTIYLPGEARQLEIGQAGEFRIGSSDVHGGHVPSISIVMESVAAYYKSGTVGILLSGMGSDGADGMAAIAGAGGYTIAQNEESSTIFGMPRQAIALGVVRAVLSPEQIVAKLLMIGRSVH